MFAALGRFTFRRRRLVLAGTGVFVLVSFAFGGGVVDSLRSGGFQDPGAESTRAERVLAEEFGLGDPNFVLVFTADSGSVDTPEAIEAGMELTQRLAAEPEVAVAESYWSLGRVPPLASIAGDQALVLGHIEGTEDQVSTVAERLTADYRGRVPAGTVEVSGFGPVFNEIRDFILEDTTRAEAIAIPLTVALLVVVFGGFLAASLPGLLGVIAIAGTVLVLYIIAQVTDVSIFSLNVATALGLGLAIDYSLFMVTRFREELRAGKDVEAALVRTVETAGRTVFFGAVTVAVSLSALLLFPQYFLRSFAYSGIAVVAVAGLGAVVSLSALLATLGERVNRGRFTPRDEGRRWRALALWVMRRPVVTTVVVVAFLLVLGLPFLGARFAQADQRVLPTSSHARQVADQLAEDFSANEIQSFAVVAAHAGPPSERVGDIGGYAAELSRLDNIARVDAATGSYFDGQLILPAGLAHERFQGAAGTWFSIVPDQDIEPTSPDGERMVRAIRAKPAPFDVLVGGDAAELVDSKAAIASHLPTAVAVVVVATLVLLFLMFGGILVPLKAIVLNTLSLTATFGAMVWVFQDGHGAGLLGFTPTGTIDTTMPILMFCIAFGVSMDYEVFLLSRIREEYDRTGDNEAAVVAGLQRTGRVITAAAAVLSVTFLAFATSRITFIQLFGLGLALAVIVDASIVRGTLVPAFMKLAGNANWWAPAPLRRIYDRYGIPHELPPTSPEAEAPAPAPQETAATTGPRKPRRQRPLVAKREPAPVAADGDGARTRGRAGQGRRRPTSKRNST